MAHDEGFAEYAYDVRNLVSEVTNGSSPSDSDPNVASFTYTDRRQVAQQTKPNANIVDYTYYLDGKAQSMVETKSDGTLVAEHALDYSPNGHRIRDDARVMDADDNSSYLETDTSYTYDPRDRIAGVERTGDGAGSEAYVHDANNNVISRSVDGTTTTFNYDRNRLLTSSVDGVTATYNYDPFGRLDTITSAGEVIQRKVYDGFDKVIEHREHTSDGEVSTAYAYDPLGRTTTKTTNAGTAEEETTSFNYLGLSNEVLDEEVAGEITKSYQYSPWGQRLSQIIHHDDGTQEDGHYGYNLHSDVEQLTDEAGDTTATYGYTAYGDDNEDLFTGVDAPDVADPTEEPYNVYRFNAKRWDHASGDYDMGFRDYNPGLNRFLTRDMYNGALADLNMSLNPYTSNRYAFGAGNPITNIEIDGHTHRPCPVEGAHPAEHCGRTGTPDAKDLAALGSGASSGASTDDGDGGDGLWDRFTGTLGAVGGGVKDFGLGARDFAWGVGEGMVGAGQCQWELLFDQQLCDQQLAHMENPPWQAAIDDPIGYLTGCDTTSNGNEIAGCLTAALAAIGITYRGAGARAPARTGVRAPEVIQVGDVRLPGVPSGSVGTPVKTGKGLEYQISRGTPELDSRVVSVRIMDPVTSGKYQYPHGYAAYMNEAGQTVNPLTGQVISPSHPFAHLPLPPP